jgi:hypothetical protein
LRRFKYFSIFEQLMVNPDSNLNNIKQRNQDAEAAKQQVKDDDQSQSKCTNCGWGVSSTADICENCGEWQLPGKCNFCYAEIEEGQKFCGECGNPPTGIYCPSCGTLSHFDFCPKCNAGLTKQSNETIHMIANSVEFQHVMNAIINPTEYTQATKHYKNPEMDALQNYLAKFSEKKTKKKSSFTLNDKSSVKVEDNLKSVEETKENITAEEQKEADAKNKELLALKLLEDTRSKTFPNNQEARKFFGALKILLPQVIQKKIPKGWRCNAYFNLHENGPQECSATCAGGTWIYETKTETEINYTVI